MIRTALFLVLIVVGTPQARGADLETWDQEKVAAVAEDSARAAPEPVYP